MIVQKKKVPNFAKNCEARTGIQIGQGEREKYTQSIRKGMQEAQSFIHKRSNVPRTHLEIQACQYRCRDERGEHTPENGCSEGSEGVVHTAESRSLAALHVSVRQVHDIIHLRPMDRTHEPIANMKPGGGGGTNVEGTQKSWKAEGAGQCWEPSANREACEDHDRQCLRHTKLPALQLDRTNDTAQRTGYRNDCGE